MDARLMVAVASTLIALAALVFSVVSFSRQQERAERHARASVKPYLWIQRDVFIDLKSIRVMNSGIGPAIIRRAAFTRENRSTDKIVELFDVQIPVWEVFARLAPRRAVPAQQEIVLVRQSVGHLLRQGISEHDGLALLRRFDSEMAGIQVTIEYEDILGNRMEPYSYEFD